MTPVMVLQDAEAGFDATHESPVVDLSTRDSGITGSMLVRSAVVPVPASMWLFGSGLVGLFGVARRKVRV